MAIHPKAGYEQHFPMHDTRYPVEAVWRELFSRVFSGLGRMVCLANCRDSYVNRRFKELTGKPFHRYLRELRMRNAARLLTHSTHDVKNIAAMVGYADGGRFSKHFRMWTGYTPLEFRYAHKKMQPVANPPVRMIPSVLN